MLYIFTSALLFMAALQSPPPDILPIPPAVDHLSAADTAGMVPLVLFDQNVQQIVISPDAALLAAAYQYIDYDYRITIYQISTRAAIAHIGGFMDLFDTMAWSPDSRRLAVASGYLSGGNVDLVNIRTYTLSSSFENAYGMGRSDTRFSYEFDRADFVLRQSEGASSLERQIDLKWSPAGELISMTIANHVVLLDVALNQAVFAGVLDGASHVQVQWSSDSQYLITTPDNGPIQLWGVPR